MLDYTEKERGNGPPMGIFQNIVEGGRSGHRVQVKESRDVEISYVSLSPFIRRLRVTRGLNYITTTLLL